MLKRMIGVCGLLIAMLIVASPASAADSSWSVRYYNNNSLSGSAVYTETISSLFIDEDWGFGSPDDDVDVGDFSARFTREVNFAATDVYEFIVTVDDGARLYIDGVEVLDEWDNRDRATFTVYVELISGDHDIELEYYEDTGEAEVALSWNDDANVTTNWVASFYANRDLSGTPSATTGVDNIDFDFGTDSPRSGLPDDNFSIRFTRFIDFANDTYCLTARADDGVRVYVDGTLVINEWRDQSATTFRTEIQATGDAEQVIVEYYDHTGSALIQFNYTNNYVTCESDDGPPVQPGDGFLMTLFSDGVIKDGIAADTYVEPNGATSTDYQWSHNIYTNLDGSYYNWARWYPDIDGQHDVWVYIPDVGATTRNARYWVYTLADGYTSIIVDQAINNNRWVYLGAYTFDDSRYEFVSVSDVTYEPGRTTTVAFDSVLFIDR